MNKRGCISCFLLSPSSRKVLSRLSASFKDGRQRRALQARSAGAWCPLLQAGTGPRSVAPQGDCGPWGKDLGLYCWLCTAQWHVSHTSSIPGGSAALEASPQAVHSGSHCMSGEAELFAFVKVRADPTTLGQAFCPAPA